MVSKATQAILQSFVDDLRATHNDNLAAVMLYGSATIGDTELRDDLNLVVALKRITPEDLRAAQAPMRELQRLGFAAPIYFTLDELRDAADVFPIEFHRMERSRVVLHGVDPLANLKISDENLRHQTEYELRSKLIQLRRAYIPASNSVEKLCDLMSNSLTTFTTLFPAVLLLQGKQPPLAKREIVHAVVDLTGGNREPFDNVFKSCGGNVHLTLRDANDLCGRYIIEIERIIRFVNGMT